LPRHIRRKAEFKENADSCESFRFGPAPTAGIEAGSFEPSSDSKFLKDSTDLSSGPSLPLHHAKRFPVVRAIPSEKKAIQARDVRRS
jgi:hypothetical protein